MGERWTVEVDGAKCVANGMCVAAAPEHFVVVDGIARPTAAEVAPSPEVLEAAELCPRSAITIRDSGGEIIEELR